jgi:hypothetical protein
LETIHYLGLAPEKKIDLPPLPPVPKSETSTATVPSAASRSADAKAAPEVARSAGRQSGALKKGDALTMRLPDDDVTPSSSSQKTRASIRDEEPQDHAMPPAPPRGKAVDMRTAASLRTPD